MDQSKYASVCFLYIKELTTSQLLTPLELAHLNLIIDLFNTHRILSDDDFNNLRRLYDLVQNRKGYVNA
jgi:hypothetical protein